MEISIIDNYFIITDNYILISTLKADVMSPFIEPSAEKFAEPRGSFIFKDSPLFRFLFKIIFISIFKEHVDDERPSKVWVVFKWIFIIVFGIVFLVGLIYASYWFYNKQTRTKKRFY